MNLWVYQFRRIDKTRFTATCCLFALLVALLISSCQRRSQQEVTQEIEASAVLKSLDYICTQVPKPADLKLSYKSLSGNSQTAMVNQQFTGDSQFDVVAQAAGAFLLAQGWSVVYRLDESEEVHNGQRKFGRGDLYIVVEHVHFQDADYSYGCSKEFR